MPLVRVTTSSSDFDTDQLAKLLSKEVSTLTNKSETYVMVIIEINEHILFSKSYEPSAYIEVKSIGSLNSLEMSKKLCLLLAKHTSINPSRIYINFDDIHPSNWGCNGTTFG